MPAEGTPFFTGCAAYGIGVIDQYITVVGGAVFHPNGWPGPPPYTNFATIPVTAQLWLDGVYLGSQGAVVADPAHPIYYDAAGRSSTDLVNWSSSPFTGYPNRLVLWPPPVETDLLVIKTIGGLSTCKYSTNDYPATEGSSGVGAIVVYPFAIRITQLTLVRGQVGVQYGDTTGFYGPGVYLSGTGFAGNTSLTFTSSTLPAGLSIVGGSVISGTPTVGGSYPVTIRATDSQGYYHERFYVLRIGVDVSSDVDVPPGATPPPGADPDTVAGGAGMIVLTDFETTEGRGISLRVPNTGTEGGWGIDRVDVKVRREERA